MSAALEARLCFMNSLNGPGNRRGNAVNNEVMLPTRENNIWNALVRSRSLPGLNIPAGYSQVLGNRLSLDKYANLNGKYTARLDVPTPCRARRKMLPERSIKTELEWQAPGRMKPETMPPAGRSFTKISGKRIIDDSANVLSNVDTLIWGRDVDGSEGCRAQAHNPMYRGSAGVQEKFERTPAWGEVPPVCKRTFGEDDAANNWDAAHYDRKDPRGWAEDAQ